MGKKWVEVDWSDTSEVDKKFPSFLEYVYKVRGFMNCPAREEIKLWYDYKTWEKGEVK